MMLDWIEIDFELSHDGLVIVPEVTDAKLVGFHLTELNLWIEVCCNEGVFGFMCENCLRIKIDKFVLQNWTSTFYLSKNGATLDEGILNSLLYSVNNDENLHGWDEYGISADHAISILKQGDAVLFGNDPSVGCEISAICKDVKLFKKHGNA